VQQPGVIIIYDISFYLLLLILILRDDAYQSSEKGICISQFTGR